MSNDQALPASSAIFDTYKKLTEKPVVKKEITKQDRIASLANSDSFKELQQVIDMWIESLKNIPIDPQKDTVESVGFRYLASDVTINYLQDLRDMPDRYLKMKEMEAESE